MQLLESNKIIGHFNENINKKPEPIKKTGFKAVFHTLINNF